MGSNGSLKVIILEWKRKTPQGRQAINVSSYPEESRMEEQRKKSCTIEAGMEVRHMVDKEPHGSEGSCKE